MSEEEHIVRKYDIDNGTRVRILNKSELIENLKAHGTVNPSGTKKQDAAVKAVVEKISASRPIHLLINNTGGPAGGEIINESTEKFEAVFRQHLSVNQVLTQTFLPQMKSVGFGRIVNVISVSVKQPIVGLDCHRRGKPCKLAVQLGE